jgi:hypothetical protein
VVKLQQARRPHPDSGQRIGLGKLELAQERLAVRERAQALLSGLVAVSGCGVAVFCCHHALLGDTCAGLPGTLAYCFGTNAEPVVAGCQRAAVLLVERVVLCQCEIASVGDPIVRAGHDVAILRDPVALCSGVQTRLGGLLTLAGRPPANVTVHVVRMRVGTAGGQLTITRSLIAIRRKLVSLGACLIALRAGLIDVRQGLLAVGKRLLAVGKRLFAFTRPRSRSAAVPLSRDRPVGRLSGPIT